MRVDRPLTGGSSTPDYDVLSKMFPNALQNPLTGGSSTPDYDDHGHCHAHAHPLTGGSSTPDYDVHVQV